MKFAGFCREGKFFFFAFFVKHYLRDTPWGCIIQYIVVLWFEAKHLLFGLIYTLLLHFQARCPRSADTGTGTLPLRTAEGERRYL